MQPTKCSCTCNRTSSAISVRLAPIIAYAFFCIRHSPRCAFHWHVSLHVSQAAINERQRNELCMHFEYRLIFYRILQILRLDLLQKQCKRLKLKAIFMATSILFFEGMQLMLYRFWSIFFCCLSSIVMKCISDQGYIFIYLLQKFCCLHKGTWEFKIIIKKYFKNQPQRRRTILNMCVFNHSKYKPAYFNFLEVTWLVGQFLPTQHMVSRVFENFPVPNEQPFIVFF